MANTSHPQYHQDDHSLLKVHEFQNWVVQIPWIKVQLSHWKLLYRDQIGKQNIKMFRVNTFLFLCSFLSYIPMKLELNACHTPLLTPSFKYASTVSPLCVVLSSAQSKIMSRCICNFMKCNSEMLLNMVVWVKNPCTKRKDNVCVKLQLSLHSTPAGVMKCLNNHT